MKHIIIKRSQRGQAMTEFVAAMALAIPLIFGVIYIGKYTDVKHQTIQASRYAALSRAMDPHGQQSTGRIRDEAAARFFRDGAKYGIAKNDRPQGATAGDTNANWYQVTGAPILGSYNDVRVSLNASRITNAQVGVLNAVPRFGGVGGNGRLNSDFGVQADVQVPLARVLHFGPLDDNFTIGATTVIAGDPWNGGGAEDVGDRFGITNVPAKLGSFLSSNVIADTLFDLLAGTPAPKFGCVKVEVVPSTVGPQSKYDTTVNPRTTNNPNDKCY